MNSIYAYLDPNKCIEWLINEKKFWETEKSNASVTRSFFNVLCHEGWKCVDCTLPKNPNWARRIQDLKDFGYLLSTDTNRYCPICGTNKTHIMLLKVPRNSAKGNGYETWSPKLRKRIIKLLNSYDVYEGIHSNHCLPDHKFSEIRWDENTKEINPDNMTDSEIKKKFQLLTNQRNQQKREVCRNCFQTNKRGKLYNIDFYYRGDENWDSSIPKRGKDAEKGCIGCGWYDIEHWKKCLQEIIDKSKKD